MFRPGKTAYRIVFIVLLIILAFLTVRAFFAYQSFIEKSVYGKSDVRSLRGWMSMDYISKTYDADEGCLCRQFNVTGDCPKAQLWKIQPAPQDRPEKPARQLPPDMSTIFEKVTLCQAKKPAPADWMSFQYMSRLYPADLECVCRNLSVNVGRCPAMTVQDFIRDEGPGQNPETGKRMISQAIQSCQTKAGE
jgi:hypothetical protein